MIVNKWMSRYSLIAISVGLILSSGQGQVLAAKESKGNPGASANTGRSIQNDETAIRSQMSLFSKALADGDAKALASLWSPDGNYIDVTGSVCKGRASLEKRFADLVASDGRQFIELVPDSIRFISTGVAASEGIVRRRDGISGPTPETRYSMVFVKDGTGWLISTACETPLLTPSEEPLKELSFLIGEWSAEKNGGTMHMQADWAANKNFITCKYEVKKSAGAPLLESRQVIGWDPRSGQPISWHFDSNGGFGFGNWIKKDRQWLVEATGVERDGSTTTATNAITLDDSNNISWQSVNRSVNGIPFNDAEPLKVHRVVR